MSGSCRKDLKMELRAKSELRFIVRDQKKILQQKYVTIHWDENGNGDMEEFEGEEEWIDVPLVDEDEE